MHRELGDIFHEKKIGTGELPLAMHRGDEHTRERDLVELLDDIEHGARERARPTARDDLALAHIGGDDELSRK
jgi:hypothetical protein